MKVYGKLESLLINLKGSWLNYVLRIRVYIFNLPVYGRESVLSDMRWVTRETREISMKNNENIIFEGFYKLWFNFLFLQTISWLFKDTADYLGMPFCKFFFKWFVIVREKIHSTDYYCHKPSWLTFLASYSHLVCALSY